MKVLAGRNQQKQRLQLIEQAVREKTPKFHRDLQLSGKLQAFLAEREKVLNEAFEAACEKYRAALLRGLGLENINGKLEEARHAAWQDSLEQTLSISDHPQDSRLDTDDWPEEFDRDYEEDAPW